ncbi:DUF397 domain-containing protein [Actinomadura craniellae]|uniref:DUF397 domain-containing protein n=1 Tax=Actinomadura craniellae TaxID=2231787 RepID=A0A365H0B8_9ACTN|nr:DUF397 domain-containing protein [Actinomadura craniellae]RAY12534.1 DUF397 domain-containing protein [Actinomadura craniellae]
MDLSQAVWRKSSRSDTHGTQCVEVAALAEAVAVRDSRRPDGRPLIITPAGWAAFLGDVKRGTLD